MHRRFSRAPSAIAPLLLAAVALSGCFRQEEPPPPPVPRTDGARSAPGPTAANPPANIPGPTGKPVSGGAFNRFFPKDGDGYNVVYAQEKKGFALADVMRSGKKVAQLSISDVAANPQAVAKYRGSTRQVAGYPSAPVGSQGTAVLVAGRYQVQVRTAPGASLSPEEREAWIGKFDLGGLARVK